jgi:hypothetical protein
MTKLNWYAHGPYETESENEEELKRVVPHVSPKSRKRLAEALRNFFYEVKFNVEFDEMTGKIKKVTMESKV